MNAATSPPDPSTTPVSPSARRPPAPTWRDPRLVVGVAIVAVSVLLGARLLGGADDSVRVWSVRADMSSGTVVGADDLVRRDIRFSDSGDADRYVSADEAVPAGATLVRDVGAGELLPRAALGHAGLQALVEVPVSVAAGEVPDTVRGGSVVDVWVTLDATQGDRPRAVLVFDDVVVVSAPRTGTSLGPSAERQVIVGVGRDQESGLADALALTSTGTIVITKQG